MPGVEPEWEGSPEEEMFKLPCVAGREWSEKARVPDHGGQGAQSKRVRLERGCPGAGGGEPSLLTWEMERTGQRGGLTLLWPPLGQARWPPFQLGTWRPREVRGPRS